MAARAIWKGVLRIAGSDASHLDVPVKLFSAVQYRQVRFHLLHAADGARVRQRMIHPESGELIPAEEIRKGFEAKPETFALLEKEELAGLEPEPSRDIELTRFVEPAALAHQCYDRPYYQGPDGSKQACFALAQALTRSGKEGVARWVMRKKRYLGALRATGERYLLLVTLRHAGEVITSDQLEPPGGRARDAKELRLAEQLDETLEGTVDPSDYRDEYRERVLELVEKKRRSGNDVVRAPKGRRARSRGRGGGSHGGAAAEPPGPGARRAPPSSPPRRASARGKQSTRRRQG